MQSQSTMHPPPLPVWPLTFPFLLGTSNLRSCRSHRCAPKPGASTPMGLSLLAWCGPLESAPLSSP